MTAGGPRLSDDWLVRMFLDSGLDSEEARRAGNAAWLRILKRERGPGLRAARRSGIRASLVGDPMVSFNRIVGLGDARLPFYDDERGSLDLVTVATLLDEVGMAPDVALAFAKVVTEAFSPADLYQPVWDALGESGEVDLEVLARMDWSPLREGVAELAKPSPLGPRSEPPAKKRPAR